MVDQDRLFARLARSTFRSRFRLGGKSGNIVSIRDRRSLIGMPQTLFASGPAPAAPINDGKQTPMRGHPVFIAQHATATCCRGCLEKWHAIPHGRALSEPEQDYIVQVIHRWLVLQMNAPSVR
ncbi:DUF4186 domain-containing protein [Klebsiella pneumoniae]